MSTDMNAKRSDTAARTADGLRAAFFGALALLAAFWPLPALATQGHGGPEGLHVHQIAHVFFTISMVLLIYWLHKWRLVKEQGWRYIQYAAFFLIIWNVDAFSTHWMEEQTNLFQIRMLDQFHIHIDSAGGSTLLDLIYYFAKLDHLLCVPALVFLFLGLRRLYRDLAVSDSGRSTAA